MAFFFYNKRSFLCIVFTFIQKTYSQCLEFTDLYQEKQGCYKTKTIQTKLQILEPDPLTNIFKSSKLLRIMNSLSEHFVNFLQGFTTLHTRNVN